MKENSNEIWKDIKKVENYLANSAINETNSNFFKNGGWETVDLEIPKAMQHILADYKKVLKENEEHIEKLQEKNKQLEILRKEEYTKFSIKDIFDVKIHNFNYLSETDWSETQRIIDKEIANILQQILQELLESE